MTARCARYLRPASSCSVIAPRGSDLRARLVPRLPLACPSSALPRAPCRRSSASGMLGTFSSLTTRSPPARAVRPALSEILRPRLVPRLRCRFLPVPSSPSCSEDRCARHSTESRAPSPRCSSYCACRMMATGHGTMGNPWMPGDTSGTAGNPDRDRPRARFPARASGFLGSSTRNLPQDPFSWFGMLDSRVYRCPGVLGSLRAPPFHWHR